MRGGENERGRGREGEREKKIPLRLKIVLFLGSPWPVLRNIDDVTKKTHFSQISTDNHCVDR